MNADALQIEAEAVEVRHLNVVGAVPGVAPLLAAARNGTGTGVLLCQGSALSWRAPGSTTFGDPVECAADGQYTLADGEDADKWLRVAVYADYLVSGSQAAIALAEIYNNAIGGDDISAANASAGTTIEYAVTLRNVDELPVKNFAVWLETAANLTISLDGANWSAPTTEASGLTVAAIEAGETAVVYVRKTITAVSPASPKNRVGLNFAFDAYPTV